MTDVRKNVMTVGDEEYAYYAVSDIEGVEKLPIALTVLVENVLRNANSEEAAKMQVARIVEAGLAGKTGEEIEFSPARAVSGLHGCARVRRLCVHA